VGPTQVAEALKNPGGKYYAYNRVNQMLLKLVKSGKLEKIGQGRYLPADILSETPAKERSHPAA
jgi:hypothetical protein